MVAIALAKRPEDRYQTAGQFAAAVADALRSPRSPRPSVAPPSPPRVSVTVTPVPPKRWSERIKRRTVVAGVAATVVGVGVLAWLAPSESGRPSTAPNAPATSASSTPTPWELMRLLPAGYPPGACTPKDPTDSGSQALAICGANLDPGGPSSATYSKAGDAQALQAGLAQVMSTATTVVCPGNIQSPARCGRPLFPTWFRAPCFVAFVTGAVPRVAQCGWNAVPPPTPGWRSRPRPTSGSRP